MSEDRFEVLINNPLWGESVDTQKKLWLEYLEATPPEDRKKWLEGEWKPLECEHSVLNVPKIT